MRRVQYMPLFCTMLAVWVLDACSEIVSIDSVALCRAPAIRNDSLIYTLDMHFRVPPKYFWSYYDDERASVVAEFLAIQIDAPYVEFPPSGPVRSLKVKNMETRMTLNGMKSQIIIAMDQKEGQKQVWVSDMGLLPDGTVRLTIWKKMEPRPAVSKKKNSTILYTGISFALVLVGVVLLILQKPD
jgi:hypothetical protein